VFEKLFLFKEVYYFLGFKERVDS